MTGTHHTRKEWLETTPELGLFWMYWSHCSLADTESRSIFVHWQEMCQNLGSSSAGVLNGTLRSFLALAASRCESTITLGTWRRLAFVPWNVQHGASSSRQQDDPYIPISRRKFQLKPNVDKVIDVCYPVSRHLTNLLRHHPKLRELDSAVAWEKLLTYFQRVPWRT